MKKRTKKLLALITVLTITIGSMVGCENQPTTNTDIQDVTVHLEWDSTTQTWNGTVKFQENQTNGFSNEIDVKVTDVKGDDDATINAIRQALGLE